MALISGECKVKQVCVCVFPPLLCVGVVTLSRAVAATQGRAQHTQSPTRKMQIQFISLTSVHTLTVKSYYY